MSVDRQLIRKQIRQIRRALSPEQQNLAEHQATAHMLSVLNTLGPKRVAIYLSHDGELSTDSLIAALWQQNIEVVLPRLHPFSQGNLQFYHYHRKTPMVVNPYGIAEPKLDIQTLRSTDSIDVMITPLVAFDHQGNRMGMGKGFYDRTLAHRRVSAKGGKTPLAIGFAHTCQQVPSIPCEAWDIPLEMLITPEKIFDFSACVQHIE